MLFVPLPGAGREPRIWHRVIPELQQRGHDAIVVRLLALVDAMIPVPGETARAWWEDVDHARALAPVVAEHGPLESWDAAAQVAVFLNDVEPAAAGDGGMAVRFAGEHLARSSTR